MLILGLREVAATRGGFSLFASEGPGAETWAGMATVFAFDSMKLSNFGLSDPLFAFDVDFLGLVVFFGFVSLPAALFSETRSPSSFARVSSSTLPLACSSSACTFHMLAAAKPAYAPAGTCCAFDPLFNSCGRGRVKALGERSWGDDRVVEAVFPLGRALSGVIEGGG